MKHVNDTSVKTPKSSRKPTGKFLDSLFYVGVVKLFIRPTNRVFELGDRDLTGNLYSWMLSVIQHKIRDLDGLS